MSAYLASFDRIGRKRNVPPLAVTGTEREIEAQILRYARPHLGSQDVDVHADAQGGHGVILVGMAQNAGRFTLEATPEVRCSTCSHELKLDPASGYYVHLDPDDEDGCVCIDDEEGCEP